MHKIKSKNLVMLEYAAEKLDDLCQEIVFVGGCTTALLITDPATPDIRYTYDVDCIVDVISLNAYYRIEEKLRQKGFEQNIQDDVICRWRIGKIILDIMPTDEQILGFTNRWYKAAVSYATQQKLSNGQIINIVTPAYFLATKLEAFKSRGKKDFLASHDLEDIITVIDGRPEICDDVKKSDTNVKNYLTESFKVLIQERRFADALPGHLNYSRLLHQERLNIVWDRIKKISYANP